MRELALLINKKEDLKYIDSFFQDESLVKNNKILTTIAKTKQKLLPWLKTCDFTRIYFGTEFCQNLIPNIEDLKTVFSYALKNNLEVTLLTPIVTNYGIRKLDTLFAYIKENYNDFEVVFNDWGVYELLQEKYPDFVCIAGRLIDKTVRDPRIGKHDYQTAFTKEGLYYIRRPSITSKSYQEILSMFKVSRVELDFLPQGFDFVKSEIPTSLSIYMPFGYIATGRRCMTNLIDREVDKKFKSDNFCQRKCRLYSQIMFKRHGTFSSNLDDAAAYDVELYGKGNTVFYLNDNIDNISNKQLECFDRIIYEVTLSV